MKEGIAQEAGIQVKGTFNAQRFFGTLALILSQKENLSITVKVHEDKKETPCGNTAFSVGEARETNLQ